MKAIRKYIVEAEVCGTCVHYRQHYVLTEQGRPCALWYGHCRVAGARRARPDEYCPRWEGVEKEKKNA